MNQASAPTTSSIPPSDLLGLTVILLTASYRSQEFVRIGYYVHTEYEDEELRLQDPPPRPPLPEKMVRTVAADKPRVTRFNIDWYVLCPRSLPEGPDFRICRLPRLNKISTGTIFSTQMHPCGSCNLLLPEDRHTRTQTRWRLHFICFCLLTRKWTFV